MIHGYINRNMYLRGSDMPHDDELASFLSVRLLIHRGSSYKQSKSTAASCSFEALFSWTRPV